MYKIFSTPNDVSRYAAQHLAAQIQSNPCVRLGLATGSTMEPVYACLVESLRKTPVSLSRLTTFNLDEYIGLDAGHVQSYSYYMRQHLFDKLNIPEDRLNLPDGMADDVERACRAYSEAI